MYYMRLYIRFQEEYDIIPQKTTAVALSWRSQAAPVPLIPPCWSVQQSRSRLSFPVQPSGIPLFLQLQAFQCIAASSGYH